MIRKKIKVVNVIVVLTSCYLFLVSCKNVPIIPDTPAVSFKSDIQPILIGNCTESGCHSSTHPREFSLITYDDVTQVGVDKIYQVITGKGIQGMFNMMPPSSKKPLNDQQVTTIYLWIQQGYQNN